MERYQVTIDPDSKIKNDPNDWVLELADMVLKVIEGFEGEDRAAPETEMNQEE